MSDPIEISAADGIATVLGSRDLRPVDYVQRHRQLAAHLGFDVSATLATIDHIPLCMHGSEHVASRRRLAKLIAESTDAALSFINDDVPGLIAGLLMPGTHDVMTEFVDPCVTGLISANIGTAIDLDHDTLVSRLFSQTIGVSKRRRMNLELAALQQSISDALPKLNDQEIGDRVALCIVGTDALRGTLGCSLKMTFEGAGITPEYPKTGVPYIDRAVVNACPINGVSYAAGATLRARLDIFEQDAQAASRHRFFGFGAHVCLGRKIALRLWEQVQKSIQESEKTVSVQRFDLRRDDVFHIPETFEIEVFNA